MATKLLPDWKRVKLKDVCEKVTVGHVGPMVDEYVSDGVPFLRSQNIKPFSLDISGIKYISQAFHQKLKKSALFPGDVAIIRTGYPGIACVIPSKLPEANCADLVIIRPSKRLDSYYLTCLFNSTWGKGTVAGSLVGVAQQHFNVTAAKEMEVPLPPLKTQQKIATILSTYDNLIENNTRRIKILEEMAQTIYREWFVNFRFPGHEKVKMVGSSLGEIPEGWEVGPLLYAADVIPGYAFKSKDWTDTGVPVIKIKNIQENRTVNVFNTDFVPEHVITHKMQKFLLNHGDILIAMTGATAGKIGKLRSPITMALNQRVAKIQAKGLYKAYIWQSVTSENARRLLFGLADGAAQPNMSGSQIENVELCFPTENLLTKFNSIVSPIHKKIDNLYLKNQNLCQSRDLLLPKLISGAVDVSALEIEVKETAA